jgi:hypothetical protein
VGDGSDLGNWYFRLNALLFAWDQTKLIVAHEYSLSLLSDIDAKEKARQFCLAFS